MKIDDIRNNGFILALTCWIFDVLRQVSLFQQVKNISKWIWTKHHRIRIKDLSLDEQEKYFKKHKPLTHTYLFPELWVIGNAIFGMIVYCLMACKMLPDFIGGVCVVLGCLRMFEILVYHINVMLFDPIINSQNNYAIKSATRMLILLLINMLEYVLYFSIVYLFFIPENLDISYWQIFSMSVSAFMNIDMPSIIESPNAIMILVRFESVLGVFMNLICIARVIGMLPSVRTKDCD